MKIFDNLTKKTKVGIIISIVLSVLLLITSVISTIRSFSAGRMSAGIHACLGILIELIIIWYVLTKYKQPHGNSLRFAYFAFALDIGLIGIIDMGGSELYVTKIILFIAALIIAYISGRLNKIEKNKKLLVLVGLLLLACAIIRFVNIGDSHLTMFRTIGYIAPMARLFALGFAYTARYEQHKEAGLEDKQ